MILTDLNAFQFLLVSKDTSNNLYNDFITALIFSAIISLVSIRLKFLNISGAVAVFILAILIFTFGGWKWTIPILTFFIMSSLLSKFPEKKNKEKETYIDKKSERDYFQVIANGGIAGILVVTYYITQSELLYLIYVSSLSAVCADTWSTEIGTMKRTKTINILTLKPVAQGISGGISFPGTVGGFAGSFIIAFASLSWVSIDTVFFFLIIIISGLLGNLTDSFLGASIQGKYKCTVCGTAVEQSIHCSKPASHTGGLKFVNNDVVNLTASASGGVFGYILYEIIQI